MPVVQVFRSDGSMVIEEKYERLHDARAEAQALSLLFGKAYVFYGPVKELWLNGRNAMGEQLAMPV